MGHEPEQLVLLIRAWREPRDIDSVRAELRARVVVLDVDDNEAEQHLVSNADEVLALVGGYLDEFAGG